MKMVFDWKYDTGTIQYTKIYHTVSRLRSFLSPCHQVIIRSLGYHIIGTSFDKVTKSSYLYDDRDFYNLLSTN